MISHLRSLSSHARRVLLASVGLLVLMYLLLSAQLLQWFAYSTQRMAAAEPRYSRLAGLLDRVDVIHAAGAAAADSLGELVYPASADMSSLPAIVQQDIRRLMDDAGLAVSGSKVLEAVERESLLRIPVELTASGSMESFERALRGMQQGRPLVFVEKMELAPQRSRSRQGAAPGVQNLQVSMRISVVKLR